MKYFYEICCVAALVAFGATACTASDHHDQAHGSDEHADIHSVDHSKFGHMSAIYLCGEDELQTSHTDEETTIAYLGKRIMASRKVSVVDNAFAGETFNGKLDGQTLIFKGIGYDASLSIGGKVTRCEKISCIPLGGPH